MLAKITTKGQITLPKKIRDHLHVKPGDQLDFCVDEQGKVSITPVIVSVKELKGFLPKPRKPVTLDEMDRVIRRRGSE
ncbi:MAG: AbrB family transcriptional regulator [Gammaproteobacteria bacterium]|nr:MAG: AbrB family transcriptional regulator [Gammaproteobacteria bacterium]